MLIDKPTFDVRRNKSRSERVEIGGGRLDLFADEDEFRAVLDMDMAASTQLRGQAKAARTRGQPLADVTG